MVLGPDVFECTRTCLRGCCNRKCAGGKWHAGKCRCLRHAQEVARQRQRKVTKGVQAVAKQVMSSWPIAPEWNPPKKDHEDPLVQKVADAHGLKRVVPGLYEKSLDGNLTEADVAESYRMAKGAELVFTIQKNRNGGQGFRQGLMAAEEVVNRYRSELVQNGLATMSPVVPTIFSAILSRLGAVLVDDNKDEMRKGLPLYDSDRPTAEIRNLVEPVAQGLFADGKYAAEMAVRGLLVRTEKLSSVEATLARTQKTNEDLTRKVQELEGRLNFTTQRMDSKTRANLQLNEEIVLLRQKLGALPEMQVIKGLQTQVDRMKKENADLDRRRKKHFEEATALKAKLDVRTDETTWKSSDGKKLLPREFMADHLMNTIRYIERLPARDPEEIICDYDGDAGPIMDNGEPPGPDRFKVYPLLLVEARKRGFLLCHDRIRATVPPGTIFTEEPNTK